jgi:hypothetical protein
MKKSEVLKILNPILFSLVLLQLISVVCLKLQAFEEINDYVHVWNAYAIGLTIALHVYFNWSWIKTTYLTAKKKGAGDK